MEKKIYSWIVILSPILGLYYSFIPFVTISNLMIMIFLIYALGVKGKILCDKSAIYLLVYIVLNLMYGVCVNDSSTYFDLVGSTLRYLLYIFCIAFCTNKYFDYLYGRVALIRIGEITSIYLGIQFLLAEFFGVFLPGGLPFFETTRMDMRTHIQYAAQYGYRPRSLFGEPAHFCQYVLLALTILLFDDGLHIKKKKRIIIIYILSILISRSLLGIFVLAFILCIYALKSLFSKEKRVVANLIIIIPVALGIITFVAMNTSVGISVVQRLTGGSFWTDNRMSGIFVFADIMKDNKLSWFLGNGLINFDVYLNSYFWWLYSFGIIGLIVLGIFFVKAYKRAGALGKYIFMVLLFLGLGSELFLGIYMLLYLSFGMAATKTNCGKLK